VRVALLGELEVLSDAGETLDVRGAKLRALLAVLSLSPGRPVSTEQIVDALWGEDPPQGVRNGLQGLVSKLRKALRDPGLIETKGTGYVLAVAPEAVDVYRFERLVDDASHAVASGDHERALELFVQADRLWRGDVLGEFAYDDFAAATITRLTELRLVAIEERMECELALGRHQGAIAVLEQLVGDHPLRERLRGLLMVALYRGGRQADALRVFQEGRAVLAEELGLDPGPELRRLEAAVLAQDPALDRPADAPVGPAAERRGVPVPLTPLVGRERELVEVAGAIERQRLVTLVGPGGVGKTRLALEAARRAESNMRDGAVLVEFAPVGDPESVAPAIAAAIGAPDPSRLAQIICDHQLLMVFDNCEHVIDVAASLVDDLLQRCPNLRVLATSREALRITGEEVWPVPPLGRDDAAQLFVQRAHAAGAQLDVSDDLHPVVSEICARLDGLPLAIELAAARTRAFPVSKLAERLDDRFRVLTGGSRTALPRQQTLRAVVDWSYDLLFDDQRRVFERLSVFPAGCTLDAAVTVCADDVVAPDEVEELLEALVDKSLVTVVRTGHDVRYVQLQTLLHYGREKLAEHGDAPLARDRMAAYCAELCDRSLDAFRGSDQRAWLAAVSAENDNLRAALDWAIATDDADVALRIAGGVFWPLWLWGRVTEAKRWLDDAFACRGLAATRTSAVASLGRAWIDYLAGYPEAVDDAFDAATAAFREAGDSQGLGLALGFRAELALARARLPEAASHRAEGNRVLESTLPDPFSRGSIEYGRSMLALLAGDSVEADAAARAAIDAFAASGSAVMEGIAWGRLAESHLRHGRFADAAEGLERAIQLNAELGLTGQLVIQTARLGIVHMAAGDLDAARTANDRALEMARRSMDGVSLGTATSSVARLALRASRLEEASAIATEALGIYAAGAEVDADHDGSPVLGIPTGAANAYLVLGFVAERNGDGAEAWRLHIRGLEHAVATHEVPPVAAAMEGLAGAALVNGDGSLAATLLGHASRLREEAAMGAGEHEQHEIDRIRGATMDALGDDAFSAAFEHGRRLDAEDALELVAGSGSAE
jgi:predicted ATPase/DNA-binding SARP family transcriptional activator